MFQNSILSVSLHWRWYKWMQCNTNMTSRRSWIRVLRCVSLLRSQSSTCVCATIHWLLKFGENVLWTAVRNHRGPTASPKCQRWHCAALLEPVGNTVVTTCTWKMSTTSFQSSLLSSEKLISFGLRNVKLEPPIGWRVFVSLSVYLCRRFVQHILTIQDLDQSKCVLKSYQ